MLIEHDSFSTLKKIKLAVMIAMEHLHSRSRSCWLIGANGPVVQGALFAKSFVALVCFASNSMYDVRGSVQCSREHAQCTQHSIRQCRLHSHWPSPGISTAFL